MADASLVQASFLGGEYSKLMQGRVDRPEYRTGMNVCLNGLPIESGAWVRRPGFRHARPTRGGAPARLIKFDFQEATPYNMEFTDGHVRFLMGVRSVTTNDDVAISGISSGNPTVIFTTRPHGWSTGDRVFCYGLGAVCPLLQNRNFVATVTDSTHFSLADELTGAPIDGALLGWVPTAGAMVARHLDIVTQYAASIWDTLRSVQTEETAFLLHSAVKPYAVRVAASPTATSFAAFSLAAAVFNDGPYLDPFINGVQANPSAKVGIISITLSFPTYDATTAYAAGAFVTYSAVNYESLVDQNVNHQPDTSPSQWVAVNAGTAIAPNGFQGSDVGRLVRLFSEPAAWAVGTAYVLNNVVGYNPSGEPGATTYWTALQASTGKQPGLDLDNWTLTPQGAAIWTWGKITSLTNQISGTLAGSTNLGDMASGGGLAAAFDGTPSKISTASATKTAVAQSLSSYVGKNYSGASNQQIASAVVFPATDQGFSRFVAERQPDHYPAVTINLRGKATAPGSDSDGTLLGTSGLISNTVSPVAIQSNDIVTHWKYLWIEIIGEAEPPSPFGTYSLYVAQVPFFNPLGGSTSSNGVNIEILGPPLLYTTPIHTWRLGVYSDTTGWPTCGTYAEGRLWLSGAVPNRIDACVSNGIIGAAVNFAPTNQFGVVAVNSAISYVFNAPDANPIFWMTPELQGIVCGTQAGEWLVQAPTAGGLSPFNIAARRVTTIGGANIEPRRTEHTTVFVQKFGRKIMEYFADVFSGKFTAPNLTFTAKHIAKNGIDEIAYQKELAPVVWSRIGGTLAGCTYKRDTLSTAQPPNIAGWHRHTLGSGRSVDSICVGPSVGGNLDSVSVVTNDQATGIRHIEVMTDILDEGSTTAEAWYLDDAVVPTSTTSDDVSPAPYGGLTLNGLWHLNGKTVTVMAGGLDCGDHLVTNGSLTVPYGDSVSAGTADGLFDAAFAANASHLIIAGFTYTSDGQIVRPHSREESGARNGPAFGKNRRVHLFAAQLDGAQGVSFGTSFAKLDAARFKDYESGPTYRLNQQFSGIHRQSLTDDYSFDGMLCWRLTRPYICNIAAVGLFLQTQDM